MIKRIFVGILLISCLLFGSELKGIIVYTGCVSDKIETICSTKIESLDSNKVVIKLNKRYGEVGDTVIVQRFFTSSGKSYWEVKK